MKLGPRESNKLPGTCCDQLPRYLSVDSGVSEAQSSELRRVYPGNP